VLGDSREHPWSDIFAVGLASWWWRRSAITLSASASALRIASSRVAL
jgi:hypothetical protein